MNTTLKILNMESELKRLKNENSRERMKNVTKFSTIINKLINETPTGELRNELTELNILHQTILKSITNP